MSIPGETAYTQTISDVPVLVLLSTLRVTVARTSLTGTFNSRRHLFMVKWRRRILNLWCLADVSVAKRQLPTT